MNWFVQAQKSAPPKQGPTFVMHPLDKDDHQLVYVDPHRFDQAWQQDQDFYIHPHGQSPNAIGNRYQNVAKALQDHAKAFHTPTVALSSQNRPAFTDGRHRFAYLRDHGYSPIPVAVPKNQAHLFQQLYGPQPQKKARPKQIAPN